MIGLTLQNRYRIDVELGRGAMGAVYRGHDTLLHRDVAVKLLSQSSSSDLGSQGWARLLHEAQAAAQLNHPNIVSIYDAGEAEIPGLESRLAFLVMELLPGQSLYERRSQSFEEIISIGRQVSAALEHAHNHGVIHRDLKPENIILTPDGQAKLTDFGLAHSVATRLKVEGAIVGTVFYLPPEAALGQEVDGRADLYSLGVILYELATGVLPFSGDDPLEVISQHLYSPLIPPRAHRPEIPLPVNDLILHLLAKEPEDRPASAGEVRRILEILEELARIEPTHFGPERELPALDRLVRGRLVGRERELAEMSAAWSSAAAGAGQVVLVSGEPGIGKTRLVRELMARAGVSGGRTLAGSCYAEGGAPYAPFPELIYESLEDDPHRFNLPEYVLSDLVTIAPELRKRLPEISPAAATEAQTEQQRIFESVLAWMGALAAQAPVLLFLDDVHWADSGTLYLLRHLARRAGRLRLLIVLTYREIELNEAGPLQLVLMDFSRERLASRIKLTRLDREQTLAMLNTILSPLGDIDEGLVAAIYRETEGNPFFIEEVTKALIEEGKLCYRDVCWTATNPGEIEIPQSVRLTVQSRLARLPGQTQEVLRMAAVLGREFDFETLRQAIDLDEDALIEALETAEKAQIIDELPRRRAMSLAFSFAHALIPSTLREGISGLRRQRLHRRAAQAIETVHPEKNGRSAQTEALAYHYEQAGDAERARMYYTRAGDGALAVFAHQEAEHHFRAALEMSDTDAGRAPLYARLGEALFRQSQYEEAIQCWQEAIQLSLARQDLDSAAHLYARSARAAWYVSDASRGLALCREGLSAIQAQSASQETPETPGYAALLHETARALRFNGQNEEALPLCRQALAMAQRLGLVEIQAEALATLGILPNQPPQEAQHALEQAVQLAESAGLLAVASRAHLNLGGHLQGMGRIIEARTHALQARTLAQRMGIVDWEFSHLIAAADMSLALADFTWVEAYLPILHQLIGQIPKPDYQKYSLEMTEAIYLVMQGDWPEAVQKLRASLEHARQQKDEPISRKILSQLGLALNELGQVEEAGQALAEAVQIEDDSKEIENFTPNLLLVAVRAWQGRLEEARSLLSEAQERFQSSPFPAFGVLFGWSEAILLQAEGRWEESIAVFERTVQQAGSFGMRWYQARIDLDLAAAHLMRAEPQDLKRARAVLEGALAQFEEIGAHGYAARCKDYLTAAGAGRL